MSLAKMINTMERLIDTLNRGTRSTESSVAFQEQRNVISNNAPTRAGLTNDTYKGKGFSRGCRGFFQSIEVYARNWGVADEDIVFGIAAEPEATEQFEVTVTIPRGLTAEWHTGIVGERWDYWGMFIYVKSIGEHIRYAYDNAVVTDKDPDAGADAYTSIDSGDNWLGEDDRRYWFRLNQYFQSLGELGIGGHVTIIEIADFLRTAITNPDGVIVGEGLPYNLTTILTGETHFNNLLDATSETKSYAPGDPFTAGWMAGYGLYPNSIRLKFTLAAQLPRQPFYYENEQIEINISTSGGTLIYNDTIGKDTNTRWAVFTVLGTNYYVMELTEEINHKKVLSTEQIIVTLQNLCGFSIEETVIQITGVPVIEP